MKKTNIKWIALGSIAGIGGLALYKYNKARKIEKNTEEYLVNLEEEVPKRKYITLFHIKGKK